VSQVDELPNERISTMKLRKSGQKVIKLSWSAVPVLYTEADRKLPPLISVLRHSHPLLICNTVYFFAASIFFPVAVSKTLVTSLFFQTTASFQKIQRADNA
jgi:hypothetical protein